LRAAHTRVGLPSLELTAAVPGQEKTGYPALTGRGPLDPLSPAPLVYARDGTIVESSGGPVDKSGEDLALVEGEERLYLNTKALIASDEESYQW
jgi:hypothetical protein